ncbi:MAG: flagellar hook-basal body complex protein FliE [bacterium]
MAIGDFNIVIGIKDVEEVSISRPARRDKVPTAELIDAFGDMLRKALGAVNDQINESEELQIRRALGEDIDFHTVMDAQAKARFALDFTIAVRKGILDAYEKISQLR